MSTDTKVYKALPHWAQKHLQIMSQNYTGCKLKQMYTNKMEI